MSPRVAADCRLMALTCVCFHLRRAARAVTKRYDDRLSASGLRSTQLTLLTALTLRPDASLVEVGELIGLEQSALSRAISVLKRRKLLQERAAPNRRERRVVLSASGRAAVARAFPRWTSAQAEVAGSVGDVARAVRLLDRLAGGPPMRMHVSAARRRRPANAVL